MDCELDKVSAILGGAAAFLHLNQNGKDKNERSIRDMGFMDEVSVFAKGVGKKAKGNYDVVAMNTKVSSLRREIQGIYPKIGEQYYAIYKEAPDEALKDFVETIKDKEAQIAEIQRQIEDTKEATVEISLKTANSSDNQEVDVNIKYCSNCGTAIPVDSCFCTNCGAPIEKL